MTNLPKDTALDEGEFVEKLQFYYGQLFPASLFYKWLSYGNVSKDYFERREFSFTLPGDIYIRYQSFRDEKALRGALISKVPVKIDIGAVFSANPRDMKKGLNIATAQERELVIDIDMTDYDEIRTCCKGADLCKSCWPFLAIAAKVLDRALREDFGFKHLLWVYSGRRGVHCWVADERARKLSVDARSAVGSYLTLISGGQFQAKKCSLDHKKVNLHPSVRKALDIIDQHFVKLIVETQNQLGTRQMAEKMINLCPNSHLRNDLMAEISQPGFFTSKQTPVGRWERIEGRSQKFFNKRAEHGKLGRHFIQEVKIQYCYPRLDIAVTKGLNHLLKAPFCVHPKTSRVCVPIDVKKIDSFDPKSVPTLDSLQTEIEAHDLQSASGGRIEAQDLQSASGGASGGRIEAQDLKSASGGSTETQYAKTQLKESIEFFEEFIRKLAKDNREARLQAMDSKMEF